MSSHQFKISVDKFARSIKADVVTLTKLLSLKIFAGVVRKTPVDQGVARAGWVIGVGAPAAPAGTGGGSLDSVLSRSTRIANISSKAGYPVVYISNYVPYIFRLEEGSSSQSPNGMVAVTMAEINTEARTILS